MYFAKVYRADCPSQGIKRGFRLDLGSIRLQTLYSSEARFDFFTIKKIEDVFFFGAKLVITFFSQNFSGVDCWSYLLLIREEILSFFTKTRKSFFGSKTSQLIWSRLRSWLLEVVLGRGRQIWKVSQFPQTLWNSQKSPKTGLDGVVNVSEMEKYILQFGQIHLTLLTNMQIHFTMLRNAFYNFEKYTNTFYNFEKCILQFWKIHFTIWTNTLYNLDKYIIQFGQTYLTIWTIHFVIKTHMIRQSQDVSLTVPDMDIESLEMGFELSFGM